MTETPEPKEPKEAPPAITPERRFVQRSIQELVRWSPLGGASWAFASFLLKQDWAIAAILFPVTAVSGVWAAYSKNFVDRLVEIYSERAKTDADKFVAWLDSLDEALKWQFSGFDQRYLKLQARPCWEFTTEGFSPDKTAIPMLEEVFVPLELSGYFAEPAEELFAKARRLPERAANDRRIWDLLRRSVKESQFRQLAIQAQGGFGKTTLLRHIALIYGQGKHRRFQAPKRIPFLLYLRDLQKQLNQAELPTLPDLITNHHLPSLSASNPLKPPPRWAENLLRQGDALVMLDGFDELTEAQRQQVSHWIAAQMQEYERSTFIVTSRPSGYKDYVAKRPTVPLFIEKFDADHQRRFVERWYLCQERCARDDKRVVQEVAARKSQALLAQLADPNRPELRQMAENPLLLNMLATYHRFDPGIELPRKRVELYKGICKLQLDDRPRARGIAMLLSADKSQSVLQDLALVMVKQNTPKVTDSQAIAFFRKHVYLLQEEIEPAAFLKQIVQVSELLVEREPGEYEFPHLSFQGYFAATRLGNNATLVLQNWDKSWWRETILLYTAQLPPKRLAQVIREACESGKAAAQLAYDCLREYPKPDKLDPALEQELRALTGNVQTLRYQQLEDYLKAGQWKEADNETYRLMITTVGKEEGQYFEPDELLNFPCEELRAIDQLWVKYSDSRFVFSVQKKLYLEQDGNPDSHYREEAWEKFSHANGWRVNGKYVRITYNIKAPRGHLPIITWGGFVKGAPGGWVGGGWVVLFSRIDTCEL
jgi:GUN4-like/NACHT domain